MEQPRRSLIGPLILITIGILLLLANLGVLPFTFWEIAARFWPLLLVLIGIEMIIGRQSAWGSIAALILWIALIVGLIFISFTNAGASTFARNTISDPISQPLGDIKSATIDFSIGVSTITVGALGADSDELVNGTYKHGEGSQLTKSFNNVGSEGRLALKEESTTALIFGNTNNRWDLLLNPQIPIALNIKNGVGRVTLDLSEITISALTVDGGVGTIDVTAPKTGAATMRVHGGVGSITISIPQNVAARIRVHQGLGGIRVDESRFPKFAGVYQSADYAGAANKMDVELDGGVGSIALK